MREIFNGKVDSSITRLVCYGDEDEEHEESTLSIEFSNDEYYERSSEYINVRSPRYKGLANLVGKPVRIIVEVDE